MLCTVDGRDITEHAETDSCPEGFYVPGSHITIGKAQVFRPIAGPGAASPYLIQKRLDVCTICSHHIEGSCTLCGCQLASKVRDQASACPAEHWGPVSLGQDLWFSHTGAMGDIIYSLHAVRAATPPHLKARYYVHHDASIRPRHYMDWSQYEAMKPLLEIQPYIHEFILGDPWPTATHRLDTFRDIGFFDNNLITLHHLALGLEEDVVFEPWLTVHNPLPIAEVVVFRSHRYRNPDGDAMWEKVHKKYPDKVFIGLPKEHADYEDRFGKIPYYPTTDLLHAARVLKGSRLAVGNQTSLYAIATGAGCRTVLEVDPSIPDCCFPDLPSTHLWHRDAELPEVNGLVPAKPIIHHVFHGFTPEVDTKRVKNAKLTWYWAALADGAWELVPRLPGYTSKEIGDDRQVPLINDVLDYALDLPDDDIIVWTNLDISLCPETPMVLRKKLANGGCCFARRIDVDNAKRVLYRTDIYYEDLHGGTDLFAFTVRWWKAHRGLMPKMFLACEAFDFVLRRIMLADRPNAEISPTILYHEKHDAYWASGKNLTENPAQRHNRQVAVEWCRVHGWEHALNPAGTFLLKNDWDYAPEPMK